jgi:hypothetical protein
MWECTSNTRISLNMQVAYVAQLLIRVIADQVCESTSSLTIEFNEHDKMKQEVQWIYYSFTSC